MMQNIPEVKLGLIAVSRDCFPIALSEKRRAAIAAACGKESLYECPVTVENEKDMLKAVGGREGGGVQCAGGVLGQLRPGDSRNADCQEL